MLKIIFCENDKEELKHMVKIAEKSCALGSVSLERWKNGREFNEGLSRLKIGDTPLFVVCQSYPGNVDGQKLAFDLRNLYPDAYIIFAAEDMSLAQSLTNNNLRHSGYVLYNRPPQFAQVLSNIIKDYEEKEAYKTRYFVVRREGQIFLFDIKNVLYFSAQQGKIAARLWNKAQKKAENYEFSDVLKDLAVRYSNTFVRCHHSFLVNANYVVLNPKTKQPETDTFGIKLVNGESIPVSDTYRRVVKKFFEKA